MSPTSSHAPKSTASLSSEARQAANSRPVIGQNNQPHPDLQKTVIKHCHHEFLRPIQDYNREAIKQLKQQVTGYEGWILDTGCGTGDSTRLLAKQNPQRLAVGIDQSLHRLSRQRTQPEPDNLLLLRADMVDIWRLCYLEGLKPQQHYLLYPNPWPKKKYLQRRWHGHPVFPFILAVGGVIELRTNWQVYAEEFAKAISYATQISSSGNHEIKEQWDPVIQPHSFIPQHPLTPFEDKYQKSGHSLYRVTVSMQERELAETTVLTVPYEV